MKLFFLFSLLFVNIMYIYTFGIKVILFVWIILIIVSDYSNNFHIIYQLLINSLSRTNLHYSSQFHNVYVYLICMLTNLIKEFFLYLFYLRRQVPRMVAMKWESCYNLKAN